MAKQPTTYHTRTEMARAAGVSPTWISRQVQSGDLRPDAVTASGAPLFNGGTVARYCARIAAKREGGK